MAPGEVAEWSNAPHSKCGIGASLSGVRIPPSPPLKSSKALTRFNYWGERNVRSPNQSPSLLRFRPGDYRIIRLINRFGQSAPNDREQLPVGAPPPEKLFEALNAALA